MNSSTFVRHNGQQVGPYDDDEVTRRLADGRFAPEDTAWREGWPEWRSLRELYAAAPPPPAAAAWAPAMPAARPPAAPSPAPAGTSAELAAGDAPSGRAETERELWSGSPSPLNHASALILVLLVGAAAVGAWVNRATVPFLHLLVPAGIVLAAFVLLGIELDRRRRRYRVTSLKVSAVKGFLVKSSDEVRIKDIRSISVTKHGLRGFLGVGDVEFSSAASDKAEITFQGIAGAERVRDTVRALQTTAA